MYFCYIYIYIYIFFFYFFYFLDMLGHQAKEYGNERYGLSN